jgi:hypothetical protein
MMAVLAFVVAFILSPASAVAATSATSMKTAKVKAVSLALQYPSSWTVLKRTEKQLDAQEKALRKANPKVTEAYDNYDVAKKVSEKSKFYAEDLDARFAGEPVSSVTVFDFELGGSPTNLESFSSKVTPSLESAGAIVLRTSAQKVGQRTGYRLDALLPLRMPDGTPIQARTGVLYVARGLSGSLVQVSVADDDSGTALIDDILHSVRPL